MTQTQTAFSTDYCLLNSDFFPAVSDYYPFGSTLRESVNGISAEANKFKYQGKELDAETQYFDFEARPYDKDLGRFTTVDPMREKGPWITPYTPMFNNPITFIDKNGKWPSYAGNIFGWHIVKDFEGSRLTSWVFTSHEEILTKALGGVASAEELQHLIDKQTEADEDQSDKNQYKHFLDNETAAWDFINDKDFSKEKGNDFGDRLHTFMDYTSPSHVRDGEPQTWAGTSFFHKAGHLLGELHASDTEMDYAKQMTSFYYNWEKNGSGKLDKSSFTSFNEFSRTGKMNFRVRSRQEAQGLIDNLKRMGYDVTYNGEKQ